MIKQASWRWTALLLLPTASACTVILGLNNVYHLEEKAGAGGVSSSSTDTGSMSSSGGSSDAGGMSGVGGMGTDVGGSDSGPPGCKAGTVRCETNTPQTCDAMGQWKDMPACDFDTHFCKDGQCISPRSCMTGIPGAEKCGTGNIPCCRAETVVGGVFNRSNNSAYPALVNDFRLDHFEVTVGRFRRFVDSYASAKPAPGAGAYASIADSGWSDSWNGFLPSDQAALKTALKCDPIYATWTDTAGTNEDKPMNCVSWYEAFAFCAWDGGRLPTEAEWNYVAAGGNEQRDFPWGFAIDPSHANYGCMGDGMAACSFADILNVGSKSTAGDGLWAQADMGGSVREWVLDFDATYSPLCNDCANLTPGAQRVARGGGFNNPASYLQTTSRQPSDPSAHSYWLGLRCASEL